MLTPNLSSSLQSNSSSIGYNTNNIVPLTILDPVVPFDLESVMEGFSMDPNLVDVDPSNTDCLLDQFLFIQQENQKYSQTIHSTFSTKILAAPAQSTEQHRYNEYDLNIPGFEFTEYDKVFYANFVEKFLLSLTPPHCHSLLSRSEILLPYSLLNPIVCEVFLACGASFHASVMPVMPNIPLKDMPIV